ncbi:MAG: FAD-dependent oxidoreductase [Pseudomonadales bacterium]
MTDVGIVGAGVAGLSLALALRQNGLGPVRVYEREGQDSLESQLVTGQWLSISPNGTRVLRALGLRQALDRIAEVPQALRQRVGSNGFLMSDLPLGKLSEDRFGAAFLTLEYQQLRTLLLEAARNADISIAYQHECVGIQGQTLKFTSQPNQNHQLIVGADGPDSSLRTGSMATQQPPLASGWLWHAQVPFAAVPESLQQPALSYWLGPGRYLFHGVQVQQQRLHLTACTQQLEVSTDDLPGVFASWQSSLRGMLAAAQNVHCEPLLRHPAPTAVSAGTVALIGDAGHPMAPHLDQGACLALEDAWVLSRFIDQHEEQPQQACGQYQRYRLKRVTLMADRAWEEGRRRMAHPGLGRTLDQLRSSLGSRFLPELAMQRLDWIYRYDCIRGFE